MKNMPPMALEFEEGEKCHDLQKKMKTILF